MRLICKKMETWWMQSSSSLAGTSQHSQRRSSDELTSRFKDHHRSSTSLAVVRNSWRRKINSLKRGTNLRCSLSLMACLRITQMLTSLALLRTWPTMSCATTCSQQPPITKTRWPKSQRSLKKRSSTEDSAKFKTRSCQRPASRRKSQVQSKRCCGHQPTRWTDSFHLGWKKTCRLSSKQSVSTRMSCTRHRKTFLKTHSSAKITPIFSGPGHPPPKSCNCLRLSKAL